MNKEVCSKCGRTKSQVMRGKYGAKQIAHVCNWCKQETWRKKSASVVQHPSLNDGPPIDGHWYSRKTEGKGFEPIVYGVMVAK